MKLVPVILAGGSGARLWPVSRQDYPKQFIALTSDSESLFQLTYKRLLSNKKLASTLAPPLIITNEEYRFIAAKALDDLGVTDYDVILEPAVRNTAPAIGLAAHFMATAKHHSADSLMLVLPADSYIKEVDKFTDYLSQAVDYYISKTSGEASAPAPIGTFGIRPSFPHTGYGYIHTLAQAQPNTTVMQVDKFVEKPDYATAQDYIAQGNYYWNSGMFLMTSKTYLHRLKNYANSIAVATATAIENLTMSKSFVYPDSKSFISCPTDSVDYAVMEKDKNIFVVPMDITWSDVGSWKSLADLYDKDAAGNSYKANAVMCDTEDSFVYSSGQRLVVTLGVKGVAVVDTPDAVLVVNKHDSEQVKGLLNGLSKDSHPQATEQYRSNRPWGWYESLIKRDGFQVKRLAVYPGAKLSLQSHQHRAEHWVVVCGTAIVTRGEEELQLEPNQSVYIPLGAKHRLANPGKELLVVIEVQSGDYLGEDDIIRYQDIYSRN